MTFSLGVFDPATGEFGSVIASSSPAVAARCVHLRDGVGAVHSQNVTDPRLGERLLGLLESGMTAGDAVATVVGSTPDIEFRQLTVVDGSGRTAIHSGGRSLGTIAEAQRSGAVAAGNMLASEAVPEAMIDAFEGSRGSIEERLVAAFRAAVRLGGEAGPIHSAGLSVVAAAGWRVTDLRVDWNDDPVGALAELVEVWSPQRADYITRGLDPARSPGYGVPGDDR